MGCTCVAATLSSTDTVGYVVVCYARDGDPGCGVDYDSGADCQGIVGESGEGVEV